MVKVKKKSDGLEVTGLTHRWTKLRYHVEQFRLIHSHSRFKVVPAGRRSGKTEIVGKRQVVMKAMNPWSEPRPAKSPDPRYFIGAPTWAQAKRIYWNDLKALVPPWAVKIGKKGLRMISESDMMIKLYNEAEIWLIGMDKPERVEGSPWDGAVLDEYGNMKARTWGEHVRPALADREGWCDFIGVPEGRNHYYDLAQFAQKVASEAEKKGIIPEWDYFHWPSADILSEAEIASARESMDELTFRQEMEGDFIYFQGRVYYPFDYRLHCKELRYNADLPLILCFDFNIEPGVAVVCQEQQLPGVIEEFYDEKTGETYSRPVIGTGIIGEVYIPRNSNTVAVCNKLIHDWANHKGDVYIYGDTTGGAGGSAQIEGSDWDIVKKMFRNQWENRTFYFIPTSNPRERVRVNAVNSRLMSTSGIIRMMIDPHNAPYTIKDLEGTRLLEGGDGSIDKKATPELTHLSDALGYYISYRFPIEELKGQSMEILW